MVTDLPYGFGDGGAGCGDGGDKGVEYDGGEPGGGCGGVGLGWSFQPGISMA